MITNNGRPGVRQRQGVQSRPDALEFGHLNVELAIKLTMDARVMRIMSMTAVSQHRQTLPVIRSASVMVSNVRDRGEEAVGTAKIARI